MTGQQQIDCRAPDGRLRLASRLADSLAELFALLECGRQTLLDFSGLIHSRYWYEDALSCPFDNFECFVRGMEKGETEPGYALDPNWGDNILRLIEENELQPLCRR